MSASKSTRPGLRHIMSPFAVPDTKRYGGSRKISQRKRRQSFFGKQMPYVKEK